jgi:nitric oxide reductase large subunit
MCNHEVWYWTSFFRFTKYMTREDGIANVKTCRNTDEFKLISRTCVVIGYIAIVISVTLYLRHEALEFLFGKIGFA